MDSSISHAARLVFYVMERIAQSDEIAELISGGVLPLDEAVWGLIDLMDAREINVETVQIHWDQQEKANAKKVDNEQVHVHFMLRVDHALIDITSFYQIKETALALYPDFASFIERSQRSCGAKIKEIDIPCYVTPRTFEMIKPFVQAGIAQLDAERLTEQTHGASRSQSARRI